MENKKIFENYRSKCPNCDGELDAEHKFCPFCGIDLATFNEEHRDNEKIITNAIDDIDAAKRKLAKRGRQFEEKKSAGAGKKVFKWLLIAAAVNFIIFIICGLAVTMHETVVDNKIENFKTQLYEQDVNVAELDVFDIDDNDFEKTSTQSAAGYIEQSDNALKIPFYSDSYSNNNIFKGTLYLNKDGFVEITSCDEERISISYEDFNLYVKFENSYYYDRTIDAVTVLDTDIKKTERRDDVKIGDYIFECYDIGREIYFVANPYTECFVIIEIYRGYNCELTYEEMIKMLHLECDVELN